MVILRSALPLILCLGFASAAAAADPDAPMTTAPAITSTQTAMTAASAPSQAGVADQIETYLRTSPAIALPKDAASGITTAEDEPRKVHGVADVAIGSNGYRSAFVASEVPVGKSGTLTIAVRETQFKGRYGSPRQFQSLGLGLSLGDAAESAGPHYGACDGRRTVGIDPTFLDGDRPRACADYEVQVLDRR